MASEYEEIMMGFFNEDDHGEQAKSRETYLRPPFGWPGGKSRSVPHILPHLPYDDVYCEPFGGSFAVGLARKRSRLEIYNDRYGGVTCFYRVIRDSELRTQLYERLQCVLHSREEFIWCRDTWENCEDEVERAARWYYMTVMSFTNQGRNFGRSKKGDAMMAPKYFRHLKEFAEIHYRMQNVQVENLDWRQCFSDFDSGSSVLYLDPPYFNTSKGMYRHEFTNQDHEDLAKAFMNAKGFVALSGYDNPIYDKIIKPHSVKEWQIICTIDSKAATSTNGRELGRNTCVTERLWIRDGR